MLPIPKKRKAERTRLEKFQPLEFDPFDGDHGVLYNYHIEHLCTSVDKHSPMLCPFDSDQLHPAGYKLRIGNEYYLGGSIYYLPSYPDAPDSARTQRLVIPPFDVAVIKTVETLCLPRFVIARWNLVVKNAYSGLLWVGAAQVDPGFTGHLFCPIYNLSDNPVSLDEGEDIALIDFVKTTPFDRERSKKWKLQEKCILDDYVKGGLRSALVTRAERKILDIDTKVEKIEDHVDKSVRRIDDRLTTFSGFTIGALAIIPAFLAAVLPFRDVMTVTASLWAPFAVGFSTFAFATALLHWLSDREWRPPRSALLIATVLAVIAAGGTFVATYSLSKEIIEGRGAEGPAMEDMAANLQSMREELAEITLSTANWQRRTDEERELLAEQLRARIEQLEHRLPALTQPEAPSVPEAGADQQDPIGRPR